MAPKIRDEEEGLLLSEVNSKQEEVQGRRSMSSTTPHFATTTVAVEGMTCGACTSALEGGLEKTKKDESDLVKTKLTSFFCFAWISWFQGCRRIRIVLSVTISRTSGGNA